MGKDIFRPKYSDQYGFSGLQRSTPSSRGSGGRSVTPLPQIPPLDRAANKDSNSVLTMQEVQRRAQQHEKKHLRSAAFDISCDLHNTVDTREKKKAGCKRKKKEMLGIVETQEKLAEMGKLRNVGGSMYNALPGIGQNLPDISRPSGKIPKIKGKLIAENNAVDIITRNEAMVRRGAKIKEMSEDYMSSAVQDIESPHTNNAPELIALNEARVGKAYKGMRYDEYARMYEQRRRSDDEA